jgi:uncharacterized surface protein with fasciclin (FAS1) repeats
VSLTQPWALSYVNVQGLTREKLLTINNWILAHTYDLVIISESWLINQESFITNPLYLCQSTLPSTYRHSGHQNGGLLVLAHPSLLPSITITHTTEFTVTFTIHNTSISACYFPPQMSDDDIQIELSNLPSPDVLFGDVNVRLGHLSGDNTTTFPSRRRMLTTYTSTHHLQYSRNLDDSVSRTDHVFTKIPLTWTYHWDLPFKTDHGLMAMSIPILKKPTPLTPTTRFSIKPFANPVFSVYFASYFDCFFGPQVHQESLATLETCLYSMVLPGNQETQELIDFAYESLILAIHQTMTSTLNTYDAKLVKTNIDNSMNISASASNTYITRSFKRSQRSRHANNPIQSRDPSLSPLEDCHDHYNRLYDSASDPPVIERANDVLFSTYFNQTLIKTAIRKYPNSKSMGKDNIHTLVLKSLTCSPHFLQTVTNLFQIFAATGLVPSSFSDCRLHLLLKDPQHPIAPNTRPIVLSSILRRIFEKVTMRVWHTHPHDWMLLHPSQAGFRRGFNCHSHILLSDEISRHDNPLSVFLDLSSAFDNLNWNTLKSLLQDLNCPPSSLSLIMSLICKPAQLELSVNQSNPITLTTHKGVFQGGGISAFIFALYINPLAISLNRLAPVHRPLALLFADDVQLKPRSILEAQDLLDLCTSYALNYSMTWNLSKCAVLGTDSLLSLSGQIIPTAKSYKYLGMIHTRKGVDWLSTIMAAITKQNRLLSSISDNPWPARVRLVIYRTFVRPLTDYSAAIATIWASRQPQSRSQIPQALKLQHQAGIKFIFSTRASSRVLDFLSGLGPYEHHLEVLRAGLARFLLTMEPTNPLVAASQTYILSASTHFILPFCFKSDYLRLYRTARAQSPRQDLTFATWKNRQLLSMLQIASQSYRLLAYISPYCCMPPYTTTLLSLPSPLLTKLVLWRINRAFLKKMCLCGLAFHRTHLSCLLLQDHTYAETLQCPEYQQILASPTSPKYTVLDHLLNIEDFASFDRLYSLVEHSLA